MSSVAVIGGGINGLCCAWQLAEGGHRVELFERGRLVGETSSASTKLLHGGLRYLEHGDFALVREALRERNWWLANVPELVQPLPLLVPIYRGRGHRRLPVKLGLALYDLLQRAGQLPRHHWLGAGAAAIPRADGLRHDRLRGCYRIFEGQMDDRRLGLWVADRARASGALLHEEIPVRRVTTDGWLETDAGSRRFDVLVNAAGPWARQLLDASAIPSRFALTLVRGSHLLLRGTLACGYILAAPQDGRIVFALPYQGQTLLGTTEVAHDLGDPIAITVAERAYLLELFTAYFDPTGVEVVGSFSGVRPLVHASTNLNALSRKAEIEVRDRLVSLFGGKWTTARALAAEVARKVAGIAGR